MPAPPRPRPPDSTARVAIRGAINGHTWINVYWLLLVHSGAPIATDFSSLLTTFAARYHTRFGPLRDVVAQVLECRGEWYLGTGDIAGSATRSDVGSRVGTFTNDNSASAVLNWQLAATYRGGHPRSYFAGVQQDMFSSGANVVPAFASALATAGVGFVADINALTQGGITAVTLGTVSFQQGDAWRSPPIFRPYLGAFACPHIGSQRRRVLT